jgi:hypothetical protein
MNDHDLKLLLQTADTATRADQARAWEALREKLYDNPTPSLWEFFSNRMGWALSGTTAAMAVAGFTAWMLLPHQPQMIVSMETSPGVTASPFYSNAADAQVVWVSGQDYLGDN